MISASDREADASPAIELRNISKRFGDVRANRNVSLSVRRGEIHGIVGENGAGKSTLMSILYGFYQADEGEIFVGGQQRQIRSPSDAIAAGVGMVHQHFMLVEPFTVIENVMLGVEGGPVITRNRRRVRAELQQFEADYSLDVSQDELIRNLPVGVRQRVEILKALYRRADILILDEPTGVLTPAEADDLFRILGALRKEGKTVILITHKLREIMAITDAVTVMRRGEVVSTMRTAQTTQEELASQIVGRAVSRTLRPSRSIPGELLLDVRHLEFVDKTGVRRLKDVSLSLRAGEILGVAGVSGNGQTELLAVLSGIVHATGGDILIKGRSVGEIAGANARTFRDSGIGHIPEDRQRDGLVMQFDASECAILGAQDDSAFNGRVLSSRTTILDHARHLMEAYDVRPPDPLLKASNFSGGNQQKLVVGREVERDPSILLVGQPTRGVDIGAIEQIHRRMLKLRESGKGLLLVSVELEEICALADRVIVMFDGMIVGEVAGEDADERVLGLMMAGVRPN
jgi:simple sugar transport system ATP-binding protein